MSALTITLILTDVFDTSHVGVTSSSLMDCVQTCYHDFDCASFFYRNGMCYPSSTYNQAIPMEATSLSGYTYHGWAVGDTCPTPFTYHKPTGQCLYGEWVTKRTHISATNYCNVIGGRLIVLDKKYKDKLVASFGAANEATLWAGADRLSGTWEWVTGDVIGPFINWDSDPALTPGDCLIMSRISNNWRSFNCSAEFRFICEKVIPDAEQPCGLLTEF